MWDDLLNSLLMEAVGTSGTLVNFYPTIQHYPEDSHLHTHHYENLTSHAFQYCLCLVPFNLDRRNVRRHKYCFHDCFIIIFISLFQFSPMSDLLLSHVNICLLSLKNHCALQVIHSILFQVFHYQINGLRSSGGVYILWHEITICHWTLNIEGGL